MFPKVLAVSVLGAAALVAVFELWPRRSSDSDDDPQRSYVRLATAPQEEAPERVQAPVQSAVEVKQKDAESSNDGATGRKKGAPRGLLSSMGDTVEGSNVFGPGGHGSGLNNALGGLRGGARMGEAHGVGGLGLRGTGPGGMGSYGRGAGAPQLGLPAATPGDRFRDWGLNGFEDPNADPESTFAIDVDTASYTLVRRMLTERVRPPPESVRAEELINYFDYRYREPGRGSLAVHLEVAPSPFSKGHHLLRVGVQARRISPAERRPTHLTFLVDVSGSMSTPDRLALAQQALHVLVDNLRQGDSVALVTYAGNVRRVLSHTGMEHRARIHSAIAELSAGGSTAMGSGIELAYEEARTMLRPGHISRVIVLSDGDANVGFTSHGEMLRSIEREVQRGVTLTTVGFGMGNYRDELMEQLADKGNGNSYYVDNLAEARRIFQDRLAGTLEVVAKDVKLQVVFDPRQVRRYRLVGYENRDVADRDFRNDQVDGGEIGAGHSVTALYDLELTSDAGEGLARVHVRAKPPEGERAEEAVFALEESALRARFEDASPEFRFATSVMGFAERLRGSPWATGWPLERAYAIARAAMPAHGVDAAERAEFAQLIRRLDDLERGRTVD
ncbi:MAG: von Willebrand factor type A domain-containing protein [Myxococcaceae bacterium]